MIIRAIYAAKPKTRYPLGITGPVRFAKKIIGDRAMDAIFRRVYGVE